MLEQQRRKAQESSPNIFRARQRRRIQGTGSNISIGAGGVTGFKSEAYVLGCVSHIVCVCCGGCGGKEWDMLEWEQQLRGG